MAQLATHPRKAQSSATRQCTMRAAPPLLFLPIRQLCHKELPTLCLVFLQNVPTACVFAPSILFSFPPHFRAQTQTYLEVYFAHGWAARAAPSASRYGQAAPLRAALVWRQATSAFGCVCKERREAWGMGRKKKGKKVMGRPAGNGRLLRKHKEQAAQAHREKRMY
jgi:hypothetical protein